MRACVARASGVGTQTHVGLVHVFVLVCAAAAEVGNFWETHVPLVDAEGFPRSDIPIEEVPQCVMSGVCVCVCVCGWVL